MCKEIKKSEDNDHAMLLMFVIIIHRWYVMQSVAPTQNLEYLFSYTSLVTFGSKLVDTSFALYVAQSFVIH